MRVIAGEFRSRLLESPRGMETRPTTDRLRETLFNVLQPRLEGARFLDLYAGSGANGLEALSRGARQAVLVESAVPALDVIRKNVVTLGLMERARVEGVTVSRWLRNGVRGLGVPAGVLPFDVVFLDPPYEDADEYARALGLMGGEAAGLVASGGIVVAEHRKMRGGKPLKAKPAQIADQYGRLRRFRLLEQGDAALSFFALE